MKTSTRSFSSSLYREHVDEAAFLYDQRHAYLHDPEVNWPDLRSWEERLDAHLDALVLGGALAADVCRQAVADGDAGVIYAALSVWCRQSRAADTLAALDTFDVANDAIAGAAALALCQSAPSSWRSHLLDALGNGRPSLAGVLARVAGYRRFDGEALLRGKAADASPAARVEIAWALGRIGTPESMPALWSLFESDDDEVRGAAALALMRLGNSAPVERAIEEAWDHPWARRVLAIGGNADAARLLVSVLDGGQPDDETVLALGLLGYLPAVTPLLDLLDDEKLAKPAAVALNTITGAGLHARVFVPEAFDPDELSEEERKAYDADGTLPTRRGEPFGTWEWSAMRDRAAWRAWLDENKHRFNRDLRWRLGMPYGPAALMAGLRAETAPFAVRSAICEELVVRYRLDVPFEVDLSVAQQYRSLEKVEAWVAEHATTFVPGGWYLAGTRQS